MRSPLTDALPCCAVCIKWGGEEQHWSNACLFTCGRNFDMDSIAKDKLPTMVTTNTDPFEDSLDGITKAAEEAYAYVLQSSGTIDSVFILAVTEEDITRARERRLSLGAWGLQGVLEARFAADLDARSVEYAAKQSAMEKEAAPAEAVKPPPEAVTKIAASRKAVKVEEKATAKATKEASFPKMPTPKRDRSESPASSRLGSESPSVTGPRMAKLISLSDKRAIEQEEELKAEEAKRMIRKRKLAEAAEKAEAVRKQEQRCAEEAEKKAAAEAAAKRNAP